MVIMKRNNAISKPDWKPARYDERALLHQRLLWPRIDPPCAIMKVPNRSRINHQVDVEQGVLEEECAELLSDFFKELRIKLKSK